MIKSITAIPAITATPSLFLFSIMSSLAFRSGLAHANKVANSSAPLISDNAGSKIAVKKDGISTFDQSYKNPQDQELDADYAKFHNTKIATEKSFAEFKNNVNQKVEKIALMIKEISMKANEFTDISQFQNMDIDHYHQEIEQFNDWYKKVFFAYEDEYKISYEQKKLSSKIEAKRNGIIDDSSIAEENYKIESPNYQSEIKQLEDELAAIIKRDNAVYQDKIEELKNQQAQNLQKIQYKYLKSKRDLDKKDQELKEINNAVAKLSSECLEMIYVKIEEVVEMMQNLSEDTKSKIHQSEHSIDEIFIKAYGYYKKIFPKDDLKLIDKLYDDKFMQKPVLEFRAKFVAGKSSQESESAPKSSGEFIAEIDVNKSSQESESKQKFIAKFVAGKLSQESESAPKSSGEFIAEIDVNKSSQESESKQKFIAKFVAGKLFQESESAPKSSSKFIGEFEINKSSQESESAPKSSSKFIGEFEINKSSQESESAPKTEESCSKTVFDRTNSFSKTDKPKNIIRKVQVSSRKKKLSHRPVL